MVFFGRGVRVVHNTCIPGKKYEHTPSPEGAPKKKCCPSFLSRKTHVRSLEYFVCFLPVLCSYWFLCFFIFDFWFFGFVLLEQCIHISFQIRNIKKRTINGGSADQEKKVSTRFFWCEVVSSEDDLRDSFFYEKIQRKPRTLVRGWIWFIMLPLMVYVLSRLILLRDIFFQKVDSSRQKDNPDILSRNKVF